MLPACVAMQSQVSATDEGTPHQIPSQSAHTICHACCSFFVGTPENFSHSGRTLSLRHLQPLSSPPVFLQTRSPLGHPQCCTWGEVGPLITRLSHRHLGANSFKVSVFGRTQAIKHYSNALAQDPLKRALLPTFAGKALVCHCPAHEECHADVFVQAYESEVMACCQDFLSKDPSATIRKFCRSTAGFLAIRTWWRCSLF